MAAGAEMESRQFNRGRRGDGNLCDLHIDGQVDEHRAGPSGPGDIKGLAERLRQFGGVFENHIVLGDRAGDTGHVGFLESIIADQLGPHLSGDGDQGHRIHHGIGDAGDEVGGAGAGGGDDDTHFAGGAGIGIGHVASACSWRGMMNLIRES